MKRQVERAGGAAAHRALSRPLSGQALGRPAPARRGGARARRRARRAADGRAALQSRRAAAARDARRAEGGAARGRHDDDLRHARPDRGDGPRRPHRRDARRQASTRSARRSTSMPRPATRFVGGFIGTPPMNFIKVRAASGTARHRRCDAAVPAGTGANVELGLRGRGRRARAPMARALPFDVRVVEPMGSHLLLTGAIDGQLARIVAPPDRDGGGGRARRPHRRPRRASPGSTRPPAAPSPPRGDVLSLCEHVFRCGRGRRFDEARISRKSSRTIMKLTPDMQAPAPSSRATIAAATRFPPTGSIRSSGTGIPPSSPWALRPSIVDRAYRELERLIEGQWDDGMIPHIVFHAPSDTYFPGPDVWGTRHRIPTSGITQPPVFGMALRHVHEAAVAGGWRMRRSARARPVPGRAALAPLVARGARSGRTAASSRSCIRGRAAATTRLPGTRRCARVPTTTDDADPAQRYRPCRPRHAAARQRLPALHPSRRHLSRRAAGIRRGNGRPRRFKIADVQMTAILATPTGRSRAIAAEASAG